MTFRILTSFILVLASALLTIWAAHTDARSRLYLFKPLTTSLIILTALWLPDAVPQPYKVLVVTGLAYSLAGDIFLMLPSDRFIFGLGSFLVAHILYAGAFVGGGGPRLDPLAAAPLSALWRHNAPTALAIHCRGPVACTALYRRHRDHELASGRTLVRIGRRRHRPRRGRSAALPHFRLCLSFRSLSRAVSRVTPCCAGHLFCRAVADRPVHRCNLIASRTM